MFLKKNLNLIKQIKKYKRPHNLCGLLYFCRRLRADESIYFFTFQNLIQPIKHFGINIL